MARTLAKLDYAGQLHTFVEAAGREDQQQSFITDEQLAGYAEHLPAAGAAAPKDHFSGMGEMNGREVFFSLPEPLSQVKLANALVPPEEAGTAQTRAADAAGAWEAEARSAFRSAMAPRRPAPPTKADACSSRSLAQMSFSLPASAARSSFTAPVTCPAFACRS